MMKGTTGSTMLSKTRVCIKNLPPSTTEKDLKEFLLVSFERHGKNDNAEIKKKKTKHNKNNNKNNDHDDDDDNDNDTSLEITDCRILKNSKGKSRKVAFVGFKHSSQAKYVIDTFHRTYMRMCRISVEPASSVVAASSSSSSSSAAAAATTKTTNKTTKNSKQRKDGEKDDDDKKQKKQQQEQEFLDFIGSSTKKNSKASKFWSNDDLLEEEGRGGMGTMDDEKYQNQQPMEEDNSDTDSEDDEDDDKDSDSGSEGNSEDKEEVDDDVGKSDKKKNDKTSSSTVSTGKKSSTSSDLDFLKSKQTSAEILDSDDDNVDDSDSGSTSSSTSSSENSEEEDTMDMDMDDDVTSSKPEKKVNLSSSSSTSWKELNQHNNHNDDIHDDDDNNNDDDDDDDDDNNDDSIHSSRLFVRNLSFYTTEEELETYFSSYGTILECHISIDDQKRSKGYGFITYTSVSDAYQARIHLDKVDFQGRLLHILPAKKQPTNANLSSTDPSSRNLTWKQRQELARREHDINSNSNGTVNANADGSATPKSWSTNFVRGDAVIDNLADRLGLRKGDILSVKDKLSSGDAAVRLALGETQIIEENRTYFKSHGIDMDVLLLSSSSAPSSRSSTTTSTSTSVKRSRTSFLVKNLPYDTQVEELQTLFHVGGGGGGGGDNDNANSSSSPIRVLVPPSKTIAYIEYEHSIDAKRAFRKLAYRRYKHVPIYLEWTPIAAKIINKQTKSNNDNDDDGTDKKGNNDDKNTTSSSSFTTSNDNLQRMDEGKEDDDEEDSNMNNLSLSSSTTSTTTFYIKNLNFQTTEETIYNVFDKIVPKNVISVRIPKKVLAIKGNKNTTTTSNSQLQQSQQQQSSQQLSMGYGFVEFNTTVDKPVQYILRSVQGKVVDGHSWKVSISKSSSTTNTMTNGGNNGNKAKAAAAATKLLIRNVPFQASRNELLKLFGSYGQLRKVRLPKKYGGGGGGTHHHHHRGFAFIEFVTNKEAMMAKNALSSTHLYGRHLIIEWADDSSNSTNNATRSSNTTIEKRYRKHDQHDQQQQQQPPKNKKIRFQQ